MGLKHVLQMVFISLIISLPLLLLKNKKIIKDEWSSKGRIYIHFWADWCKPCIEELPTLDSGLQNTAPKTFKILYTLDSSKMTQVQLKNLKIKHFDTIVYTTKNQTEFDYHFNSFERKVVPRNLIIKDNKMAYKSTGVDTSLIRRLK